MEFNLDQSRITNLGLVLWGFAQDTFPQMIRPPEDQDGIGSSGEEYRRALRFV